MSSPITLPSESLTMTVVVRETKETHDPLRAGARHGRGDRVDTGEPFLDHMLVDLRALRGLDLHAARRRGDLPHHLIEDVAIASAPRCARCCPATAARYGDRTDPDGRRARALRARPRRSSYYRGPLPSTLYDHWMRSFATTRGPRCTCACSAAATATTSSRRRSRRWASRCATRSSTRAPCSARRAASRCASRRR